MILQINGVHEGFFPGLCIQCSAVHLSVVQCSIVQWWVVQGNMWPCQEVQLVEVSAGISGVQVMSGQVH